VVNAITLTTPITVLICGMSPPDRAT